MDISKTMFILEIIGTISFAISGATAGIKKEMDLLGIFILAALTASGGGFIRDITLGLTPPSVFKHPIYLIVTFTTVVIYLLGIRIFHISNSFKSKIPMKLLEKIINISDSWGLAVFTVSGVSVAINSGFSDNVFLVLFVGSITGVGGGMLRDIVSMQIPSIFVRHIYAVACMIGALIFFILKSLIDNSIAMVISTLIIIFIRHISRKYELSLPKIKI